MIGRMRCSVGQTNAIQVRGNTYSSFLTSLFYHPFFLSFFLLFFFFIHTLLYIQSNFHSPFIYSFFLSYIFPLILLHSFSPSILPFFFLSFSIQKFSSHFLFPPFTIFHSFYFYFVC